MPNQIMIIKSEQNSQCTVLCTALLRTFALAGTGKEETLQFPLGDFWGCPSFITGHLHASMPQPFAEARNSWYTNAQYIVKSITVTLGNHNKTDKKAPKIFSKHIMHILEFCQKKEKKCERKY